VWVFPVGGMTQEGGPGSAWPDKRHGSDTSKNMSAESFSYGMLVNAVSERPCTIATATALLSVQDLQCGG